MSPLDVTRAALASAVSALATAEELHRAATRAEGAAVLVLSESATAVENEPSTPNVAAWREAREAREVAAMAARGTERRAAAARAALETAKRDDARARLADALVRADRSALFRGLEQTILDLVAIDRCPKVDPHAADVAEDVIAVRLGEEAERAALRALRCRTVRQAVDAQGRAVGEALLIAGELAERTSVEAVLERHVFALVALEVAAPKLATDPPHVRAEWWTRWLAFDFGQGTPGDLTAASEAIFKLQHGSPYTKAPGIGQDLAAWLAWGRALCVSGSFGAAGQAATVRA